MALKTALVPEHQTRLLGCVVCDQSQNSCLQRLCISTAENGTGQVQVPAEMSDALSSLRYATDCFDSESNERKAYRKKSRNKTKESKCAEKVFPEELICDTDKEHQLSSFNSPSSNMHCKAPSSTDFMKYNLSSTVRPSHSCVELKNFSDINSHNSEEFSECSSCEMLNVNENCVCLNNYNCKSCPIPKCKSHNPKCFGGKKSQDHRPVPKSKSTTVNFVKKNRSNTNVMRRKDQSRLTWKKCQRGRSTDSRSETMSLPDHAQFDSILQTSCVPSQQAGFSCEELAVMPNLSVKHTKAATAIKSMDADNMVRKGIFVDIRVESSQQVPEEVSSEYQDSLYCAKPFEMMHGVELDKSDGYQNYFGQSKINCRKTMRGPWSKSYRYHHEPLPFQAQQTKAKLYSKDRSTFDPLHPWMKSPRVKPVEEKHLQRFVNGAWSDASYFESNMTPKIRHGQDVTQHQSSRKWIPVCKKNTSTQKTSVSAVTGENNDDNSLLEKKEDICLEGDVISILVPDAPDESSKLLSDNDTASLMEQLPEAGSTEFNDECPKVQSITDYTRPIHVPNGFLYHFSNDHCVEQAFISSYRLQLASKGVHQTTGYPLAEFERLLWSATPAVASSVLSKTCNGSFGDLLSSLILCREKTPNISLHSVWDWYEEPGNYGLKVDVNHPHSSEGCIADTASFHAHFVPLLSAIQLFGYSYPSTSFGKSQEHSLEGRGIEDSLLTPLSVDPAILSSLEAAFIGDTLSQIVNSMGTNPLSDVNITKSFNAAEPSLLSDAELLFEFFESEQPQRRKPLYHKIMELAKEGTSNNQVFGDPSKLVGTNLDDLHPASWFSVAWYPIYRIPEGKMRTAFLTYHSLGYFGQRCTTNDILKMSPLSLALPVIGLQSYNAQGELWFSPNTEVESSLGELTFAVLKERLKTLEENAHFFARGMVSKDHEMATNRQPDYEFFMARRGKPLFF